MAHNIDISAEENYKTEKYKIIEAGKKKIEKFYEKKMKIVSDERAS